MMRQVVEKNKTDESKHKAKWYKIQCQIRMITELAFQGEERDDDECGNYYRMSPYQHVAKSKMSNH